MYEGIKEWSEAPEVAAGPSWAIAEAVLMVIFSFSSVLSGLSSQTVLVSSLLLGLCYHLDSR